VNTTSLLMLLLFFFIILTSEFKTIMMKEFVLSGALAVACSFFATAQTTLTSFEESESLGYTSGTDIGEYSDLWNTYNTVSEATVDAGVIYVSDSWASDGTQSLFFPAQNIGTEDGSNINYATTAALDYSDFAAPFAISFDAMTNEVSNSGSNFYAMLYSYDSDTEESYTIASMYFNYEGDIYFGDLEAGEYVGGGTFEGGASNKVKFRINDDSTITYLVGNEEVHTYSIDPSQLTDVYYLVFGADDWGTDWSIDNIQIIEGTAGIKDNTLTGISVYPNPSSDLVNIASTDNALIDQIRVTDLHGRVVKTVAAAGVSAVQVNIADLSPGVYLLSLTSNNGSYTQKIVKR
jgi:Secretion system C-terminal sorting domain